jgi:hypothetical protein
MATTAQVVNAIAAGINSTELFNSLKTSFLVNTSNSALSNSIVTMVQNSPIFAGLHTAGVLTANASADNIATAVRGMFANSPYFSYFNNSFITGLGD